MGWRLVTHVVLSRHNRNAGWVAVRIVHGRVARGHPRRHLLGIGIHVMISVDALISLNSLSGEIGWRS